MPQRVKILTTQYLRKYNPEVNTHTYFKVLPGTEGNVIRLTANRYHALYYIIKLDSGDRLELSPNVVQLLE